MHAVEAFSTLLRKLGQWLAGEGFIRSGHTFYREERGNWGLVQLQKSLKSRRSSVLFTFNLGVSLLAIREFLGRGKGQRPPLSECHWIQRIGFLMSEREDRWWTIRDGVSEEELQLLLTELTDLLTTVALPEVVKYLDDRPLQALWLREESPGLTDIQRLINLSVLLKASEEKVLLSRTIEELKVRSRGKPYSSTVDIHCKRLQCGQM